MYNGTYNFFFFIFFVMLLTLLYISERDVIYFNVAGYYSDNSRGFVNLGHSFEALCTYGQENSQLQYLESYYAVIEGNLGQHRLLLGSEIDCGIPDDELPEKIKTEEVGAGTPITWDLQGTEKESNTINTVESELYQVCTLEERRRILSIATKEEGRDGAKEGGEEDERVCVGELLHPRQESFLELKTCVRSSSRAKRKWWIQSQWAGVPRVFRAFACRSGALKYKDGLKMIYVPSLMPSTPSTTNTPTNNEASNEGPDITKEAEKLKEEPVKKNNKKKKKQQEDQGI